MSTGELPSVLLVENDSASRDIIKYFLREICMVEFAETGEEALEKTKAVNYAAILMDINLGIGMNGVETTQLIKKIPGYESINIAAITAYALTGDKEKFLAQGCTHYLSKPFDKAKLINLVKEMLNINRET